MESTVAEGKPVEATDVQPTLDQATMMKQMQQQMQQMELQLQAKKIAEMQERMGQLQQELSQESSVKIKDASVVVNVVKEPSSRSASPVALPACDPKVTELKGKLEELKGKDLARRFLLLELEPLKEQHRFDVETYVHLQELFSAIPQAFQGVLDGESSQPSQVVLGPSPCHPERTKTTWSSATQQTALLSYPYFQTQPVYVELFEIAFNKSPPFEQLNQAGRKKYAVAIIAAAAKAKEHYEKNEKPARDAKQELMKDLIEMAKEPPQPPQPPPPEACCCVIA